MRVLAAMSGGVDSSVAAARLVEQGHDVIGVHLALSKGAQQTRESARGCCSLEDSADARRVCDKLGIPFYVWDFSDRFKEDVIDIFVWSYEHGETPNPCLRCNEKTKFAALLERAETLGFDAVVDMNLFNGNAGQFMSFAAGNLNAGGGVLEKFQASDSGELAVLEQDNTALVVAILALAGGALGIAGLAEAADQAGFSEQDARNIADMVGQLAAEGELPVEDLRNMMIGDYQIGDLLILLDNATK